MGISFGGYGILHRHHRSPTSATKPAGQDPEARLSPGTLRSTALFALTDSQLKAVMDAARTLPVEKRDVYLQRIAAMLVLPPRTGFSTMISVY
jgi:hypothetical protein